MLSKFRVKKLQIVTTFDGQLGLKCVKNESCSKWDKCPKFQNVTAYYYFFYKWIITFNETYYIHEV